MSVRPLCFEWFETDLPARMPFRFGMAAMTRLTHALLRVSVEIDGETAVGFAAENLAPKWFKKDPSQSLEEETAEMKSVLRQASVAAAGLEAPTPFAFWRELASRQSKWGAANGLPPLLSGLGTALVERAVIDAFCRRHRIPLARALERNLLGIGLGLVHPSLAGTQPKDWLPSEPLGAVLVRHTVGLGDPLTEKEIPDEDRLEDGLPQSLDQIIVAHGVRHFKIKVAGSPGQALDRLRAVARVLREHGPSGWAVTLDGNESFARAEDLVVLGEGLAADPELREMEKRLLFIEQPFPRDLTLAPAAGEAIGSLPKPWPVIIDESDATEDSLPSALALGYAGTSHKNCKGIFKGIANACLLAQIRLRDPGHPAILSGEDLTTVPPFASPQDLAVQAVLGNRSLERNGHHYFTGLAGWPPPIRRMVGEEHPDLYQPLGHDNFSLRIRRGEILVHSCLSAPFGTRLAPPLEDHFSRLCPPIHG